MTAKRYRIVDSAVGPLTLAGEDDVLTNLRMEDQTYPPSGRDDWTRDDRAFVGTVDQLSAYFAGELAEFDVDLRLDGTTFQQRVWSELIEIPYGETLSYGEIAARLDQPNAARAVGLANGHNPIGIIVPCHRVIGSTGALTGYGGGLHRKRQLLDLERNHREPRLVFD